MTELQTQKSRYLSVKNLNRLRPLFTLVLALAFLSFATPPQHLKDLQELQELVSTENVSYHHDKPELKWGQGDRHDYTCHADCSSLINALLSHSYHYTPKSYIKWMGKGQPKAKDYYQAIVQEHGFLRISSIHQVEPGDLIVCRYLPGSKNKGDDTGHIMVVDGSPQHWGPTSPFIKDTSQWAVTVIDSTKSGHGVTDTRYEGQGHFKKGLGKGVFRLYTDLDGTIVGYTWSTGSNSIFYSEEKRPVAIGRILPFFQP